MYFNTPIDVNAIMMSRGSGYIWIWNRNHAKNWSKYLAVQSLKEFCPVRPLEICCIIHSLVRIFFLNSVPQFRTHPWAPICTMQHSNASEIEQTCSIYFLKADIALHVDFWNTDIKTKLVTFNMERLMLNCNMLILYWYLLFTL